MTPSSWRKVRRKSSKPAYTIGVYHRLPVGTPLRLEPLEERLVLSTFKWLGASGANWDNAANWTRTAGTTGSFPNAIGDIAQFTGTTGGTTATLDIPVTVGEIDFGSSVSYTINSSAAANALTLQATSGNALLKTLTSPANTGTDVIAAQVSVNASTPLSATLAQGTLKLTNISAANPNSIAGGTFTVTGGTLEGFSTQTANTDSLGTAGVVLNGGTLKVDPVPSVFSAAGVTGRYFNTAFTAANSGTSPAVGQVDYSGTPGATRSDANVDFTSLTSSNLPSGISTNAGGTNTQNNFAVEWVGGLNIMTGGSYTFTDQSDDGSQLFIDGVAVVTNNSNTTTTSAATTLSAGVHAFEVRYYQGSGGANQVISYNGPDSSNATVFIPGAASLSASGLFQYAPGSTATFTNNVTINSGITGTIDTTGAAMDATLGTLTTVGTGTLNVTGSFTGRTVNFGNVTLGGNVIMNPTSANVALGSVTDGGSNFSITKNGAGTLNLTAAANTYAGAVTLTAGTLALSNATALGTGGLSVTAGTVLINATGALGTMINLTSGETLVANTANVLSGATVNVGAGAIVQGIGANALAGAIINLNGGGLSLRADATATIGGTVNVNSNNSVIDVNRLGLNVTNQTLSIASLTLGGGATTLNITGAAGFTLQTTGAVTLPANITVNTVDANFSFGGGVSGTFTVTKVGVGTLTFPVDSTGWTGSGGMTLIIQQGTANLTTANAGGATGSTVLLQGGTLGLNSAAAVSYQINVALDSSLGVATINNVNNITNTITGTLILAPSQQFQTTGTGTVTFSTATLATSAGFYVFNTNGASLQLNGLISGSGTIVKLGGNTLILGASGGATANTYTGGSIVNAGTLQANGVVGGSLNNFGTGAITLNGGQANLFADSGQNNVYSNNIVVNNNAAIGFGRTGSTSVTNSIVYLTGTLTVGNNTLTFNQNNNYIFAISGATTLTGNVSIAGSGVVVFSGAVGDGGNGYGITKTATNTVILNGVNTYTGDTRSNSGNLAITSTGSIASSNVYVEPGAGLILPAATSWYSNATQPTLTITSSPTALAEVQLNYNGALPTMAGGVAPAGGISGGVIALGLNLALTGGATTVNIPVLGSNPAIVMAAFAGPVSQAINLGSIGDGSFFLGAASNITYNGTLTIGSGNTYRLGAGGAQLALASTITLTDSSGTQVLIGSALANGTGNLANGTGTVVLLMNNNTYAGGTVINRGSTLVVGGADATGTGGPLGLSTSPVTVYGSLTAAGNGSFLQMGSTTTNVNSTFTFQPGGILTFDNVTTTFQGITAANNNNRWGDTAAINLNASTVQLLGQNAAAATTETVGAVSFTGGSVVASKRGNTGNTVTLTVASLTRVNRGTLTLVTSTAATLGGTAAGSERIVDTAAGTDAATTPVPVNTVATDTNHDTMTAAYIVNGTDNTFVSFNQGTNVGFGNTKFSSLSLTAAGSTGVVKLTATAAISSPVSVYALAVIGNFALTGTSTITSGSGGLILQGITASQTSTPNWVLGGGTTPEALVYTANSSTFFWVLSGSVTTSGGLTKFGQGNFSLQGNNSGLTGGIVANANSNSGATIGALSGTLDFNGSALNVTTNQQNITLNGGTLNIRNNASITLTSTLTVNADSTINTDRISTGSGFAEGFNELIINNSTLTLTAGNTTSVIFQNSVSTNPSVLLTGNATFNTSTANLAIVGVVSDGGGGFGITKAISGNTITLNTPSNVSITDTYTGSTNVLNGTLTITGTGTGVHSLTTNFLVAPGATLNLNSATNVGGSNTVAVFSNNLGLGALGIGFNAALPTITGNSSGVLGINTTYNFANLNLATIGNGTFYLGSTAGGTYAGTALTIGAGNVWRLGGGGNTLTISNNIITDANPVLIGAGLANGTGALANGGGTVAFSVTQTYTGTTTITSATVAYINNTTSNSTTAFTQTLTGNIILTGNATINAGGSAAFTSNYLLIKGRLIYGGNTLTFQNGVVALDPSAPAASGTGNTVVAGGVTLHVSTMNQLSPGNLQLNNGTFVLGKDDGTGVAPSWTQFMAFYSGGYGSGMNQWQITGANGGFAAKGAPATILVNNTNSPYGYVTSQTLFDRDFRLGNDRRGNLTGVAGSQVFYANQPVILAQNTSLSAIRNISIAPTGPGVSGGPSTGVVYRITGNLSGSGAPHFQTFDTEQSLTGGNFTEASEVVLAGLNTWTGNPGNVQGVNAGAGGLILDQNVFVRFLNNTSLPTGNAGAPAFLAVIRDAQNSYGGGYLLTTGSTYTMPAGLSFLFGDTVVGSGNLRTSVLGSTSDAGGGGTATLQNATIIIANASGITGGGLAELSPSNGQTMSLLVRDGTLNLGSGANAVAFKYATEFFYGNTNLYIGDGVLNSLNVGTASRLSSFGSADPQGGSGQRTIEKDGTGTAVLNNVTYTFAVSGNTAATSFNWNVGNGSATTPTAGGLLQLGAANQIPAAVNVVNGTLDLNSFNDTITTLTLGGGAAGTTATVNTETGILTLSNNVTYSATNNPNAATINGNLNLGSSTRTFTVNHSTANTTADLVINAVISGSGGLTLAGAGLLLLTAANTYTGTTTINQGTLIVGANAPSGSAGALGNATSAVVIGQASTSNNASLLIGGAFTVARNITVTSSDTGTITLGGSTAAASVFSGTIAATKAVTLAAAAGGTVTFASSAVISGTGPVTATGPGMVILSATNTYTGATTISGGILSISADANLGAVPASATAGQLVINGGTLQVTASFTLNSNRGIALGPSSGSGTGTIDVTATNTLTYGGILANNGTGTGGLVQTDTGTLALTGANTYSGGTTINGGTLLVNNATGSGTGTGAVMVASGGTLGGTGTVSGAVTVAGGGTVNPGAATVGILTVASADFSGGGSLVIRLPAFGSPGTNYSQLNVTGALTLGGTSLVTFDLNGLSTTGTANNVVAAGSIAGTFFHTFTVNNPNFYSATPSYTATAINVTIAVPPPITLHFKFNSPGNSPPPGYTSVLPTTTYSVLQGYGWQNTAGLFAQDRHGPTPLLQDFIQGPDNTFLVDVPAPGTYVVNLTMGDLINPHGPIDIIANGTDEFGTNLIQEIAGQYITVTFSVTITGTQLQLEIKRIGGDPFWAVNAIDIRTAPIGTITLNASPPTITGDGMSTSTISGTSSLPQGSLVTVSTSLGTITTADADPNYAGIQVMVGPGGAFSFTVQAPLVGGTATITAQEVTAAASGTTTLTITPPTAFHFKFNKPGNSAPNGYISVLPTTLFASNSSYGWQSTTGLFAQDRGGPTPLLRDFIQGPDNTFQVSLANGSYLVNLTMGDLSNPHGPVDIIANGVDVFAGNLILEPSGQYVTPNFVVNVTSGNLLSLEIKRVGGDPFWAVNAIDIVPSASAVGAIMLTSSVATLNADGTSTATISGTGARPNSLITVSASLGTIITTDADPNYAGIQVQADGSGNFVFVVRAPSVAGGAVTLTANDVTGAATGSSSTILAIVPPSTFHFDFDYQFNVQTQPGYQSVLPGNVYSASAGYGWNTPLASQYRTSTPFLGTPSLEQLQRDIHLDQDNTFKILVHVTGINHFSVTVYLGDNDHPHNAHVVIGGSAGTIDEGVVATGVDDPMNPMGGFAIMIYSIPASDFTPDANGNDVLTIHLTGMATLTDPGDNFFNANGVDIVASMTPAGVPDGNGSSPSALAQPVGTASATVTPGSVIVSAVSSGSAVTRTGTPAGPGLVGAAVAAASSTSAENPVVPMSGAAGTEFDAALAQVLTADESVAPAGRWSLLGQALTAQNRVTAGMPAAGRNGGPVQTGRPEAGSRTPAVPETRLIGAQASHHQAYQGLVAHGWNRDPLNVLDLVFEDLAAAG